jgi:hypothetical protein
VLQNLAAGGAYVAHNTEIKKRTAKAGITSHLNVPFTSAPRVLHVHPSASALFENGSNKMFA